MKNIMKGLIILFSVLLLGLIGIMTYALVRGTEQLPVIGEASNYFTETKLINTQQIAMKDIQNIEITNRNCDVFFQSGDTNEMVIKEYVGNKAIQKPFVNVEENSDTLRIKANDERGRTWFVFGNNYRYFEIYLPQDYSGAMDIKASSGDIFGENDLKLADFTLNATSGYVELQSVKAKNIFIKTSSGDVDAVNLEGAIEISTQSGYVELVECVGDTQIATSSGDVTVKNQTGNFEVGTSSGYVEVQEIIGDTLIATSSGDVDISKMTGNLDISTTSGYVEAGQIEGGSKVETSSGDVDLNFTDLTDSLSIKTTSGYVSCILPEDINFQFQANTTSGEIMTDFDDTLSFDRKAERATGVVGTKENPDIEVQVNTSSGDIDFMWR